MTARSPHGLPNLFPSLAVLAAAVTSLVSLPAFSYVPSTTTKTATALRWMGSNCVLIRVNSTGSDDIKDGSAVAAVKHSLDNWRQATRTCSYLRFELLEDSPEANPGFDKEGPNENVVAWVESGWAHDAQAAALTTVFFIEKQGSPHDGQILDADVELNGVRFRFSTSGAPDRTDVENTVTHELGHLIGLDHPCDDGLRQPVPSDHTGTTIPSCFPALKLPQWLKDTTMYNFADPGETKKRSPETDDVAGVCETYPLGDDPGQCAPPSFATEEDGCAMGGSGRPAWPLLLLLLPLLLLRRRR